MPGRESVVVLLESFAVCGINGRYHDKSLAVTFMRNTLNAENFGFCEAIISAQDKTVGILFPYITSTFAL